MQASTAAPSLAQSVKGTQAGDWDAEMNDDDVDEVSQHSSISEKERHEPNISADLTLSNKVPAFGK